MPKHDLPKGGRVRLPYNNRVTSYDYDTSGRVTRIWQSPTGIKCPASGVVAGCRALRIDYASDITTTVGEVPGR